MRLRTIELKNFGAYQATNIDLSQVAAATIGGPNGAGKSTAFIDAPLWALFGKCRMDTDKILRLGTDEMTVSVGFLLNGQHYRVTRTRSLKTKAGKSELQVAIEQDGNWIPVSGARLADTQQQIIELLCADFDLLTTTGFLVQGQAARFCQATPSERKAILAQILRLDQYAELKTGATRAGTVVATKRDGTQQALSGLSGTELVIDSLKREAATIAARRQRITQELAALDRERQTLIEQQARDRASLEALTTIPEQLEKAQARRQDLKTRERVLLERRDRLEKILANQAVIEAKVEEEQTIKASLEALPTHAQTVQGSIETLTNDLTRYQEEAGKGAAIERDLETARRKVDEAVRAYTDATAAMQTSSLVLKQKIDQAIDLYLRETDRMRTNVEADQKAVQLLGQVPCDATLQGRCQFTIQAVQAKQRLETSRPELEARLEDRYAIARMVAPEKAAQHQQLLEDIEARITDRAYMVTAICPIGSQEIARLTQQLQAWSDEGWATKIGVAKTELEAQRQKLKELHTQRESLTARLAKLAEFTVLVPELQAADRDLEQVNLDLAAVILDMAEVLASIEQDQTQLAERQTLTARLAQTDVDLQETDKRRAAQTAVDQGLAQQGGQLIERIQQAELDLVMAAELRKELDVLASDVRQYAMLVEAYTVIPVLIMESAVPMLDQETNGMLAKLSTSGMQVRLETQKTLKSRDGLAETLEIIVRDVFGERPYECYSGGEKARINLAVRIGLSKLLANRAGARLETLVVDEAYGEVDQEGVAQLVECLPVLTKEFPLLLFVSHDEAFKNALSQQIIVHKNGTGSTVEVMA